MIIRGNRDTSRVGSVANDFGTVTAYVAQIYLTSFMFSFTEITLFGLSIGFVH